MNNNEILYFPDLKKFISFIINNILLLLILTFIALLGGYLKYQYDYNNSSQLIQKQLNINFVNLNSNFENNNNNFIEEQYYLDSQVKPINEYIDIRNFIYNTVDKEFYNYFVSLDIDFKYSKENLKLINITFQNHDVNLDEISNLEQNIQIKFSKLIEDYKKIEYDKLKRRFSDFMFEILVSKNFSLLSLNKIILDYGDVINQNDKDYENKIKILKEAYEYFNDTESAELRGLNLMDSDLYKIIIDDFAYKNKFLTSIELYFFNICKETRFKNDYFCNINSNQDTFKINDKNLKSCEVFSENFSYQQVILSIIDKKIFCNGGYNLSREIIYKPLEKYLINTGLDNDLFEYSLKDIEVENNIKLLNYILYSLIMGIFIFFIISGIKSIYKGK